MAQSTPPASSPSAVPNRVEFEVDSQEAVIVVLFGEQDLGSLDKLHLALDRAVAHQTRCVLVDLTACTFMDSTVITALLSVHARVEAQLGSFGLVVPDSKTPPARTIALMRLDEAMHVHASREAALRHIRHTAGVCDLRAESNQPDEWRAECSCGWKGEVRSGALALRRARSDAVDHTNRRGTRNAQPL